MAFNYSTTIGSRMNTNQSVANATWTRITFDNVVNDDSGTALVLGTDATKLLLPAAFTKVRFVLYCVWDSNSTGVRQASIEQNDGNVEGAGVGIASLQWTPVNESGQSLETPWITGLTGGTDSFHAWVYQSSTVSLNLRGVTSNTFGGVTTLQAEFAA